MAAWPTSYGVTFLTVSMIDDENQKKPTLTVYHINSIHEHSWQMNTARTARLAFNVFQ